MTTFAQPVLGDVAPDYAIPTGDYVAEWLDDNGMTQTEFARRAGISRKHLNRIIAGAPVTPEIADRLSLVTGVPAHRWLQLEGMYRSDLIRLAAEKELATRLDLVDALAKPATLLRRLGVVSATRARPGLLLREFMAFFRLGDIAELELAICRPSAAFRQALAHDVHWASVATWLRLGEIEAGHTLASLPPYSETRLRAALPALRRLTADRDFPQRLPEALGELGVAFVAVAEVSGCRAYGATRWVGDHPVVQLSLRGGSDGQFWFTLFHQLGHTLLHPRDALFVEGVDGASVYEDEADAFANDLLIPREVRDRVGAVKSKSAVLAEAAALGVAPGIIMGYLHHEKLWPPQNGQQLYVRIRFSDD